MAARSPARETSLLTVIVVAVVLLFAVGIYLVVAVPTLSTLGQVFTSDTAGGAIGRQGLSGQLGFVLDVGILLVPTMFVIGLGLWLYAAASGAGAYSGRGRL